MTAYQLAIELHRRYPAVAEALHVEVGGSGIGVHTRSPSTNMMTEAAETSVYIDAAKTMTVCDCTPHHCLFSQS
jgi:hypothetical protein